MPVTAELGRCCRKSRRHRLERNNRIIESTFRVELPPSPLILNQCCVETAQKSFSTASAKLSPTPRWTLRPLSPLELTFAGVFGWSESGRYCCKSPRGATRPGKFGNNRIRMAGSVNQNFRFDLGARKLFFVSAPKIVLQQNRS
jgi:hypothetical protein